MERRDASAVGWEWFILLVTIAYLIVETSFSAELLNIVGRHASAADIRHIEHWGRWISGFAAGLLAWTVLPYIRLRESVAASLLVFSALTAGVMVWVYHAELNLVHAMTEHASGTQRKLAVYSVFVRSGLLDGTVRLDGMPDDAQTYATAQGKAFIALLPLLAHSDAQLPRRLDGVLASVVGKDIDRSVGGPRGYFNRLFRPAAQQMNRAWLGYQRMVAGLNSAYLRAAANPRWAARIDARARAEFDRQVAAHFSVPGNVARIDPRAVGDERSFFATRAMAHLWARLLGFDPPRPLLPSADLEQVRAQLWPRFRALRTQREIAAFQADARAYDDGGPRARQGRDAMTLVTVPAMALLFSVLGMLVHLGKSSFYVLELAAPRIGWKLNAILAIAVSTFAAMSFWHVNNAIVTAPLYRHLLAAYAARRPPWPPWALTWIIRAEHAVYPLANALRTGVLRGFTFGVANG